MAQAAQQPEWLRRAIAVRDEVAAAAMNLNTTEVVRRSGGVTVTLCATGELRGIRIDPAAPTRAAELERHIMAAHQEAHQEIRRLAMGMMEPLRGMVAEANQKLGVEG